MRQFKFVKLSGKWFVDIPWEGPITDLEMVAGADTLLEQYKTDNVVRCSVLEPNEKPLPNFSVGYFTKIHSDEFGATYSVNSDHYRGDIWLCPVLKHIFGVYPDYFEVIF